MNKPRVAVVGAGISGLTAAYLLRETHEVTMYEREPRLGGHAHSHRVTTTAGVTDVDSGFIVLNERTYPWLLRLFDELGVTIKPTEMSLGISCEGCGLAYVGGRGVRGIFAQPKRVADPAFWRLLTSVRRFQRAALTHLHDHPRSLETYGQFLSRLGFSDHFVAHYALPVVSCIWSTGHGSALDYPAAYLFEFLSHHGFLRRGSAPQWYVVEGGSAAYVNRIAERLDDIRTGNAAALVQRKSEGVVVTDTAGVESGFDRVVLATHADEALTLLGDPSEAEFEVLAAFSYSANRTQLHRDHSVLRPLRSERASWNFSLSACDENADEVRISYWMNRLQGHPEVDPLVVSLGRRDVDPDLVIASMDYTHPVFTPESVAAQRQLSTLNTAQTAFAGAYHGWGFHEDGCRSGVLAARHFGGSW